MSKFLFRKWVEFLCVDEGQDLVEYALLMILIALVAVIALKGLGTALVTVFQNAAQQIGAQPGP